jgi:hypothetical protein
MNKHNCENSTAAFGILKWYYCESGNWLTISATDFHALEVLAAEIGKHLLNQATTKMTMFSAGGGSLMIQNCIFQSADEKIESQMDAILGECGWQQDFNPYNYRRSKIN